MEAVLNPFPFSDFASKSEFWIWLAPLVFLTASCLSHVYTISFFCSTSIHLQTSLNVTLAKTFQDDNGQAVKWAKLSFFIGFALGQFTVGILGDYYGKWKVWNYLIKILIILGMLPSFTSKLKSIGFLINKCRKSILSGIFSISGNLFEFSVLWFLIAYCATSSYLLVICTVLQTVDSLYEDYRFRLLCGILFQMSWTLAQFYSKLVIYLCNDWTTVTLILNIITALIYFTFQEFLWNSFHVSKIEKTSPHSYQKLKDEMSRTSVNFKLNFLILCLTWFTIGYSAYGIQNTWKEIALQGKIFEHKLITSTFEVISKILALLVCLFVKRKILPLSVLQLFFAIIYFTLMRFDKSTFKQFQELDSDDLYSNSVIKVLLVHFTDFLHKAIFSLIWIVTAESFPETYR